MKNQKILLFILVVTNGYLLLMLVAAANTMSNNEWSLTEDVGWLWMSLIIPTLMIVSSVIIYIFYNFVLFFTSKVKNSKN